ncbi:MAG: cation:proton antiporter [Spirosomaceae bacterium]|jgi:Kef-type K+ transport system membrane component KefB|nr:cation:proton antiporter [Spirosomataceae bacterium]
MSITIIITICTLLLIAYLFDLTSAKTRIPSVILLIFLGWILNQVIKFFGVIIPNISEILPILGTVGLILIVFEGSLELELNKSKIGLVKKASIVALLPMIVLSVGFGYVFHLYSGSSFKNGLANAIPIFVISSAIAIPSVRNLGNTEREFVTYESSLSDIFGVIFFNFITLNDNIGTSSIGVFTLQLFIILLISFVASMGLSYILSHLKHQIKFGPIILLVVLIYAISKVFHLPSLIFILLFGLFLGNLDELKHVKLVQRLKPEILDKEVHKLQELTAEFAFIIRALFFLVFGYTMETSEVLNPETIFWAIAITCSIFIIRYITLRFFKLSLNSVVYIAPRGLITILLFLSIPESQSIELVNKSLIIQVIILTAIVMMIGLITNPKSIEEQNTYN